MGGTSQQSSTVLPLPASLGFHSVLLLTSGRIQRVQELSGYNTTHLSTRFPELDKNILGNCPNKHKLSYSPFSNPSIEAVGRVAVSQSWKYYEDRPQKPGWIFEGRPTPNATLTFPVLYYGTKVAPLITVGYLRSYGCYGQLQVWVGNSDPWATDSKSLDLCGIIIDGKWNDSISLYQSISFSPHSKCLTGVSVVSKQAQVPLHLRPVAKAEDTCANVKFKLEFIGCCPSIAIAH